MKENLIFKEIETYISNLKLLVGKLNPIEGRKNKLIIRNDKGKVRYYLKCIKTGKEKYLSSSKANIIKQYARLEYGDCLRKEVSTLIHALEGCLKLLKLCKDPDDVYESLPKARKDYAGKKVSFVDVSQWLKRPPFLRKGFKKDDSEIYAINGMRVRSKSEALIIRVLIEFDIPFLYEYPIHIDGQDIYPDFHILNTRTGEEFLYEHFGQMDNAEYVEKRFLWKLKEYSKVGIELGKNLVATYETQHSPLNEAELRQFVEKHFL